jgi:serine/threonine-protein kinase
MMEAIMNSNFKQTPLDSIDRETVDEASFNALMRAQCSCATGEIAVEKPPRRPVRCGAAGVIFLVGLGGLCLTSFAYPPVSRGVTFVDLVPHLLVIALIVVAAVFARRRTATPRQNSFPPRQIAQYRLIAPLGAGGMGEVYLAEHRMLQRLCAIKLIRPERTGDAQVRARFEREVRMTARLSHWNTVAIFDYGCTAEGTFYYVMEYLPGVSFEEILKTGGPQPADRVVHLVRQVCQALREAHGIGLIHRDVKPANLFVTRRGGVSDVVKVLDFGLVKPIAEIPTERLTQEGAFSGTPLFMSPEQASGKGDMDGRSDIYALGAVAYALLTGRPPFERQSAIELLIAHARDEVTPPSEYCADVPADLEKIVLRCLAKKPEDRFQTMDDLDHALARCVAADRWTREIKAAA